MRGIIRTDVETEGFRGRPIYRVTLEGPQAGFMDAPEVPGWEPFFIGRVGADKVSWSYKPKTDIGRIEAEAVMGRWSPS